MIIAEWNKVEGNFQKINGGYATIEINGRKVGATRLYALPENKKDFDVFGCTINSLIVTFAFYFNWRSRQLYFRPFDAHDARQFQKFFYG